MMSMIFTHLPGKSYMLIWWLQQLHYFVKVHLVTSISPRNPYFLLLKEPYDHQIHHDIYNPICPCSCYHQHHHEHKPMSFVHHKLQNISTTGQLVVSLIYNKNKSLKSNIHNHSNLNTASLQIDQTPSAMPSTWNFHQLKFHQLPAIVHTESSQTFSFSQVRYLIKKFWL